MKTAKIYASHIFVGDRIKRRFLPNSEPFATVKEVSLQQDEVHLVLELIDGTIIQLIIPSYEDVLLQVEE